MKRDISIDFLMFIAVLLVVNSHMDCCYPKGFRFLATGGAIGDALFFFCSGFKLFIGRNDGFVCWYKRRLSRLLPSVLVCVLAYACFGGPDWWDCIGGYWFVRCILIFYVLLYIVRKTVLDRLWVAFGLLLIIICTWWFLFEPPTKSIYGDGYFKWCHYFLPMLAGATVGRYKEKLKFLPIVDCLMAILFLLSYYGVLYCASKYCVQWLQLVTIPMLSGLVYCLYKMANADKMLQMMRTRLGTVITIIGGLCLEVYLSHRVFLTGAYNEYFPFNLPVIFGLCIILAYCVRCVSRFMVQTLSDMSDYDWRKIFSLK